MANQHTADISLEKRIAILKKYDETRGMRPPFSHTEIGKQFDVHRDTVSRTINNRADYERRAKYDGIAQTEVKTTPPADAHRTSEKLSTGDVVGASENLSRDVSREKLDPPRGIDIMLIGDMQVKPRIDLGYCERIGRYCAEEKPDVIVNIGDFADMPSCSMHEEAGSKSYSLQNYKDDILSVHLGMKLMMEPIQAEIKRTGWNPRLVMCLGNHEHRIDRTLEAIPKLDGLIGLPDLEYERWGFEIYPFLQPVEVAGITFSHYFPSGQMGRPISSARAMLTKLHTSAVAGHQQGRDIAFGKRANGKQITCIIAGSAYVHDEDYLNAQTNNHWRGFYMLNDCVDGEFEEKAVSMKYLRRRYETP